MVPSSVDDLTRLRHEREDADRAYNAALTALDASIQRLRDVAVAPPAYDDFQIATLNHRWELLPLKPADRGGWLRRLRAHIWAMVAPLFERQQEFNAALVDHINRNAAVHRETLHAVAATQAAFREELERLIDFQSRLVQYAQQITPYIDTKDRYVEGLPNSLAKSISGLSDDVQKRWESMVARERRYAAQVSEVQNTLGVVHRALLTIKRDIERRGPASQAEPAAAVAASGGTAAINAYKYVGFEDQYRGSPNEIRERMTAYVADFEGLRDVLDIGCGRGEFLDLLRERGIRSRGIELNDEMAAICRERGLDATAGDALGYLSTLPDESLGGIFAAQVVEHLEPDYLLRLLDTAFHKLRPGSKIVLETVNPACWYAFFSSYIRDITHVRPLHPDTLRYLLVASGFQKVDVRYSAPFPEESKLQLVRQEAGGEAPSQSGGQDQLSGVISAVNDNATKLNDLLFTYLDYAVIGVRL